MCVCVGWGVGGWVGEILDLIFMHPHVSVCVSE